MEKLQISTQLLNQIMGYLGTRPYQEVFQLVDAMQKEAQSQVQAPADTNQISTPAEPSAQ
jgi:hypothetical protein